MDISVDFTPKPGDRTGHRDSKGRLTTYVWVTCPDCLKSRWISIANFHKLGPPRRCRECSISRAKNQGWVTDGVIVETPKEQRD